MRAWSLFALVAFSAVGQPLHSEEWASLRARFTAGVTSRDLRETFTDSSKSLFIDGASRPTFLALQGSGTFFVRRWFGVEVDGRTDLVSVVGANGMRYSQPAGRLSLAAAFRWQPTPFVGLEALLGWHAGALSFLESTEQTRATTRALTGPMVGASVVVDANRRLSLQLLGRLEPGFGGFNGGVVVLGGNIRYAFFSVGDLDLGITLALDVSGGQYRAAPLTADDRLWRLSVGPSLVRRQRAPEARIEKPMTHSVVGQVVRSDGGAVPEARVSVGRQFVQTGADGRFRIDGLALGSATVVVEAPRLRSATQEVTVAAGAPVELTMVLEVPTGPGNISGVVRSATEPLPGAKIVVGSQTLTSSSNGEWSIAQVGPGPVKVQVFLNGYSPAEEVVQVAPEASARLDVTLERAAERRKATIRGVISSASGAVTKATFRIVELKLKQTAKADGRFEVEVPGGKYSLVIEAPSYVTQTRAVEVLDGDQAIFQIELERLR